jgi:hypothetical protein
MKKTDYSQFKINLNAKRLLSLDETGFVQIKSNIADVGNIKDRDFDTNIQNLYSKDYENENILKRDPPYSGADFSKLPNVTVLPNLKSIGGRIILGSTMGHYQETLDGSCQEILEIYEFHGYGAMLIDKEKSPFMELHILKPEDKVFTLNKCNMTIFNFDLYPLITSDYANPKIHQGDKNLQREIGSAIIMIYDGINLDIKLNPEYINRIDELGVRLAGYNEEDLTIRIKTTLGEDLYKKFNQNEIQEQFKNIGIHIMFEDNSINLDGNKLSEPLYDIATKSNILNRFFKID